MGKDEYEDKRAGTQANQGKVKLRLRELHSLHRPLPPGVHSVDAANNLDHGGWQHDHIGTKCASHSGTTYVVFNNAKTKYDFPRFLTVHDEFKQMGMGVASRVSKGIKPPISHAKLTRLCGGCISYYSCDVVVGCVRSMFGSFFNRVRS